MILIGKNLGERQKDFNNRVNDAVAKKVNFDLIDAQKEETDIDVLFKIDVAAKYKNIGYILKILKSEDVLHIERALKTCDWLYDEEHVDLINPDYLQDNVFPHMSMKMQRKLLNTISLHVKDETRAEIFYNYCKKENFKHASYKFLIHTSETCKLEFIDSCIFGKEIFFRKGNLRLLVGNSSTLADSYLKKMGDVLTEEFLLDNNFLYFLSSERYLDAMETKYNWFEATHCKFSKKATEDIANKYKSRILAKPKYYLRRLDLKTLVKHSSQEEIKQYAIAKLSNTAQQFWAGKYWKTYKVILSAIPPEKKFEFVKEIFTNKYPGQEFESSEEFYTSGIYNLITKEQRIELTKNFENEKGNISRMKRRLWFKNVPFDEAFTVFEEKMLTTTNKKVKSNLVGVLIKAIKTKQDLERVINYYYKNYNKENVAENEKFLDAVFLHSKEEIFELDIHYWTILQKMLLDEKTSKSFDKYKATVYICHILHKIELPPQLRTFLDTADPASLNEDMALLETYKKDFIYEHASQHHLAKLKELEGKDYDKDYKVNNLISHHALSHINLLTCMDKSIDEIPEMARTYVLTYWHRFRDFDICKDLKSDHYNYTNRLKRNASTVTDFHKIKQNFENNPKFNLIPFLKRLNVYFAHDIAKDYLNYFKECLSPNFHERFDISMDCDRSLMDTAVIGIYMLAEENYKKEMILKYTPEADVRIDYIDMDGLHLCIQEAICRFAYISRPRLPISSLQRYLIGDFAKRCLPTISSLFANLTANSCFQLAQTLLNAPRSSQRFTFPLVMAHLDVGNLKEIVLNMWRTGQKLDRRDLFKSMYKSVEWRSGDEQLKYFSILKEMILTLRENDDRQCFEFLDNDEILPGNLKSAFLEAAWESIGKFRRFNSLKVTLIHYIDYHILTINKEMVRNIITEHIQNAPEYGSEKLEKAKWDLAATYLVLMSDDITTIDLLNNIMTKLIHYDHTLNRFVRKLLEICVQRERQSCSQANPVLEKLLSHLTDIAPLESKYNMMWNLKLAIICNKVIDLAYSKLKETELDHEKIAQDVQHYFAKEIGEVVKELIRNNQYLERFVPDISKQICDVQQDMTLFLHYKKVHWFTFTVFLVEGLFDFEIIEIQMLALNILSDPKSQ
ncbi:hypothetical protein NE865_03293 [Phthorimaea operculella]|nr:hypothetical protein NE865_03293 [Phthorimaea operculella]